MISFEWDDAKSASNRKKHRVSFDEAVNVFGDALAITFPETDHDDREVGSRTYGMSTNGRFLVVIHTERKHNVRIISARKGNQI